MTTRRAGALVLAAMLGACRTSPVGQAPASPVPLPLFGPVIGAEVIGGRADAGGEIVLLAGGTDLVRISLPARRFARVKLRTAVGPLNDECWSLAALTDGSLWTLKRRLTLAQVGIDGAIVGETALEDAHFGLFAAGDRLLFQRADFTPPGPALLAAVPAGGSRTPWSAIATRTFPSLARASVAALNMVTCGATAVEDADRACWFPDEAAIFLVTAGGSTRRVALSGLEVVAPETLLTSDNPRRPVRDAYVDASGAIWILSSGTAPPGKSDVPGGWLLARYASDGMSEGVIHLPEAARLVLTADARHVTLLMATGMVAQVMRW